METPIGVVRKVNTEYDAVFALDEVRGTRLVGCAGAINSIPKNTVYNPDSFFLPSKDDEGGVRWENMKRVRFIGWMIKRRLYMHGFVPHACAVYIAYNIHTQKISLALSSDDKASDVYYYKVCISELVGEDLHFVNFASAAKTWKLSRDFWQLNIGVKGMAETFFDGGAAYLGSTPKPDDAMSVPNISNAFKSYPVSCFGVLFVFTPATKCPMTNDDIRQRKYNALAMRNNTTDSISVMSGNVTLLLKRFPAIRSNVSRIAGWYVGARNYFTNNGQHTLEYQHWTRNTKLNRSTTCLQVAFSNDWDELTNNNFIPIGIVNSSYAEISDNMETDIVNVSVALYSAGHVNMVLELSDNNQAEYDHHAKVRKIAGVGGDDDEESDRDIDDADATA